MKVGDKCNFNFAKGKDFEIKEIITGADLPLTWSWDFWEGECPECKKKIKVTSTKNYHIDTIEILEALDGQRVMMGYTRELVGDKPLTMRLPDRVFYPDKDMSDAVKAKSKYLKGV